MTYQAGPLTDEVMSFSASLKEHFLCLIMARHQFAPESWGEISLSAKSLSHKSGACCGEARSVLETPEPQQPCWNSFFFVVDLGGSSTAAKKHLPLVFLSLLSNTASCSWQQRFSCRDRHWALPWLAAQDCSFPLVIKINFTDTFNGQDISQCVMRGNR